jgi:hypothetical protein
MYHDFKFPAVLSASHKAAWQLDDVMPDGAQLDFSRPMLPERLVRAQGVDGLSEMERLTLNHIRGHEYLSIFGLAEEFILPFVLDHVRDSLDGDDHRIRALLQFASEEAKHIHLFKRFHAAFVAGFGTPCEVIGPPEAIAAEVLRHQPLSVALTILHIEWMTQRHYLESVRDDAGIEPLFASLLKHHWMEEAQHAKLDTLIVDAMSKGMSSSQIDTAVDEYLEIGAFLDSGLKVQAELNLRAFEQASGRTLDPSLRQSFLEAQHQALRWTYLGSGMTHPKFCATLQSLSPKARQRVESAASVFC